MQVISLAKPSVSEEEATAVVDALRSGWLSSGPRTVEFEQAFARYAGAKHAVAVSSCTAALHLVLVALGVGPGDEVITSPITFVSTVNAILYAGATPVLADVEPDTLNISPAAIERKITKRTKVIIPVHMAGQPCDMDEILTIARPRGIVVVEDAAHAVGAEYRGTRIGAVSDATCFSFYATKNLTTGEGGMVTTDDDDLAERIRRLRFHGISSDAWKRYEGCQVREWTAVELGYKANFTDLQAAIGLVQLRRLDGMLARREAIAREYRRAFERFGVVLAELPDRKHAWHLFVVRVPERRRFREHLADAGIATGIHFPAIHLQPYFKQRFGDLENELPVATRVSEEIVSLPLHPDLTNGEVRRVIDAVTAFLEKHVKCHDYQPGVAIPARAGTEAHELAQPTRV